MRVLTKELANDRKQVVFEREWREDFVGEALTLEVDSAQQIHRMELYTADVGVVRSTYSDGLQHQIVERVLRYVGGRTCRGASDRLFGYRFVARQMSYRPAIDIANHRTLHACQNRRQKCDTEYLR